MLENMLADLGIDLYYSEKLKASGARYDDGTNKIIVIKKSLTRREKEIAILHELVHIVLKTHEKDTVIERMHMEVQVNWVSGKIMGYLKKAKETGLPPAQVLREAYEALSRENLDFPNPISRKRQGGLQRPSASNPVSQQ
ncbi:ImmA/IrrE family metallo-endopeptidase [Cloacibacillus porcorum]